MRETTPENTIKIGLFDSGVGGLTVLKQLHALVANYNCNVHFTYVADTHRCPYGNRSASEISQYVSEITNFLLADAVKCIVVACNTSAALAADSAYRLASPVPIHDLIQPAAKYIADKFTNVAVFATASTASSKAFSKKISLFSNKTNVIEMGCPKLVPAIESGQISSPQTESIVESYVKELADFPLEALVLGCTHFPLLANTFRKYLPKNVELIDPACLLPKQLSIAGNSIAQLEHGTGTVTAKFYVTGDQNKFIDIASAVLPEQASIFQLSKNVFSLNLEELSGYGVAPEQITGLAVDNSLTLRIEGSPA